MHLAGLEAMGAGDFPQSYVLLDEALEAVADDSLTLDGLVQSAQIVRHKGYAYMKQAGVEKSAPILDSADVALRSAVEMTAPLVSGTAFVGMDVAPSPYKKSPKKIRRAIANEHGGALSLIGRTVAVRNVITGFDSRGGDEAAVENRNVAQQPYGLAYDILLMGDDGESLVSHTMAGARQEVLNGQNPKMLPWIARAIRGVSRTTLHHRDDEFKRSRIAFRRGWGYLHDYDAARESVLIDP